MEWREISTKAGNRTAMKDARGSSDKGSGTEAPLTVMFLYPDISANFGRNSIERILLDQATVLMLQVVFVVVIHLLPLSSLAAADVCV